MNQENGKKHLLAVDAPGIAEVLAPFLGVAGYEVTVAPSVEEGVSLARALHPDAVLTDACPSGPEGPQLCLLLKSILKGCTVPVICLSGHGGEEVAEGTWLSTRILRTIKLALTRGEPKPLEVAVS